MTPSIAGVLAIWLLAVVSPGPAFLVLSRMAAGRSRVAAFGTALGIAACALLFAVLTLYGLAVVVTRISWLGYALRIAGAAYLVCLGIQLLRSPKGAATPRSRGGRAFHANAARGLCPDANRNRPRARLGAGGARRAHGRAALKP